MVLRLDIGHQALLQLRQFQEVVLGVADDGRAAGQLATRVDQVHRVERPPTVVALIAASAWVAAVWTTTLDVPIGQEAARLLQHRLRAGIVRRTFETGEFHRAADASKDQTYFLFATTRDQLNYLRFPIGHLPKDRVRALAAEFGLKIAAKPDSQDICFVPNGNYASVIEKLRPGAAEPGELLPEEVGVEGDVVGHERPLPDRYPRWGREQHDR